MPLLSRKTQVVHPHLRAQGHGSRQSIGPKIIALVAGAVLFNILLLWPLLHNHPYLTSYSTGAAGARGGLTLSQPLTFLHSSAHHVTRDNFLQAYDSNSDGVLDEAEFGGLVEEACAIDREGLSWWQRLERLFSMLVLQPTSPCHGARELLTAEASTGGTMGDGSRLGPREAEEWSRRELEQTAGDKALSPEEASRRKAALEGCSPLAGPLLQAAADHGVVLVAVADWSMFDVFGVNWLTHIQRAGIEHYLIVALDQKTADFLSDHKLGHCALWAPDGSSRNTGANATAKPVLPAQAGAYERGGAAYKSVAWSRLEVAEQVLALGYDVLLTDLDTVWFRDPVPYLQQNLQAVADLVVASKAPATANKAGDIGLEITPGQAVAEGRVSLAVMYARASGAALKAVRAWLQQRSSSEAEAAAAAAGGGGAQGGPLPDPQEVLVSWLNQAPAAPAKGATMAATNPRVLRVGLGGSSTTLSGSSSSASSSDDSNWFGLQSSSSHGLVGSSRGGEEGVVRLGVFSPRVVGNGYSHFVSRQYYQPGIAGSTSTQASYLAVHIAWGGSTKQVRLHNMRDAMWYADGPKYYSDPRLLSFELEPYTPPKSYNPHMSNRESLLQLHIAALTHQLGQFYVAAAAAVLLDRALVLPDLQCYCWSAAGSSRGAAGLPVDCRAPGDGSSVLPFPCTLDQVFRPDILYSHPPISPTHRFTFRERSFLQNPRLPSWLPHSKTEVLTGNPICSKAAPGGPLPLCTQVLTVRPPPGTNQQVMVPEGLTETQLQQLLEPFAKAKWIHLKDPLVLFKGFENPGLQRQFEGWLDVAVRPWCCRESGTEVGFNIRPQTVAAAAAGHEGGAAKARRILK